MGLSTQPARRRRRCGNLGWPQALGRRLGVRSKVSKRDGSGRLPARAVDEFSADRIRLRTWSGELRPRDDVERYLVRLAVTLSWDIDRAERSASPSLSHAVGCSETAGAAADAPPSDDIVDGERIDQQQLSRIQAMMATLDVFIGLRRLGVLAATGSTATPEPADAPPAAEATPGDRAREQGAEPPGRPEPRPAVSEVSEREEPSVPARPPIHDRIVKRRRDRPDWPESGARAAQPAAASGDRCDPTVRSPRGPDAPGIPPAARRCVGGYPVPLDSSAPVSRADRIPIRSRRHEAGARLARGGK
jgi:hypothetical protein